MANDFCDLIWGKEKRWIWVKQRVNVKFCLSIYLIRYFCNSIRNIILKNVSDIKMSNVILYKII